MVSVVHLRQLEAAKKLGKRKYWSDEDEEKARAAEEEAPELTEEERLMRVRVYEPGDVL